MYKFITTSYNEYDYTENQFLWFDEKEKEYYISNDNPKNGKIKEYLEGSPFKLSYYDLICQNVTYRKTKWKFKLDTIMKY